MNRVMGEGEALPSRYRAIAKLGRGAFAVAYRCEDVESGGEVVVKLYELRERAWSLLTSFEREAAVLAQLSHPAIPRYVAHGQLPDGRLMLVQSYAAGRSLAELLRERRRFTDAEVADMTEQVLDVLEYLQGLNPPIVHRDIKPGNLVLTDAGRVQLVDFGSVKEGFRRDSELGSTIVGTYGYMAPEQFQGRATIRSDLYGLGATLVHVLSHVPPSELPQEGLKLDFHGSVKASPGFTAWLDRLLEPDPRERFANATEARAAFRARDTPPPATARSAAALAKVQSVPRGSHITVQRQGGELRLTIPGAGFRRVGLSSLGFSGSWLAFTSFWAQGVLRVSPVAALFALPFLVVGGYMLRRTLLIMFEQTNLSIGPERYRLTKRLWWKKEESEGATDDLEGAGLLRGAVRVNGQRLTHCVLLAGAQRIKFGASLGPVERRWVVRSINQHLGLHDADEWEDDE